MASTDVGGIAAGVFLVKCDIAQEAAAREAALEQIVTEDAIFGQSVREDTLERIDIVDALADKRAFAEEILVDIRDGECVRIDARGCAEQP